jgi:hypothetical protein
MTPDPGATIHYNFTAAQNGNGHRSLSICQPGPPRTAALFQLLQVSRQAVAIFMAIMEFGKKSYIES